MSIVKNFEIAAEALYNEAPSDRARVFAENLAEKIRNKGAEWIQKHATALHITDPEVSDDGMCSIESNRLFYLSRWQLVLASAS